ncbi:MAG: hypothetical protein ABIT58_10110, partial [Ferruginibacter sp.]
MKKIFFYILLFVTAPIFLIAQIAVKAEIIYTVSGMPVRNGVVLIKDGKIENIGPATSLTIPADYKTYEAKTVTPGLVDARTLVGISGSLNIPTDQDQLEKSIPIQPDLRAIDAYNPEEPLVRVLR